ncbi:hypothetical protein BJV85_002434 [Clostridium acetobutylicum]|nr:hypothetical protein [Clostridium acetobutylicum]NOW15085.1 hypothetical protein [Clostridium acetobutylicum]NRY56765.1 hypothetical protein [Clostridium acetobutylicum]NSA93511.1 hypothetical protein [Clostridium acetobutylicum]NYC94613.1 hypothetical protein [Clostridium acetobutylicum]
MYKGRKLIGSANDIKWDTEVENYYFNLIRRLDL